VEVVTASAQVREKRGGDHHRLRRLKKVTMLALSHTILSMSTRTRELSKSTLLSKESSQRMGYILTS
jgi:hypothetical protein